VWSLLKDTAANWSKHKAARLGVALAYYSIFSLWPLLVIAVAVAGLTFQQEAVHGEVSAQLRALLGDTGANVSASYDRPTDAGGDHHVHAAVERSPYAAALAASLVGWLLGRLEVRHQRAGGTTAA
jgi:hypothetical protein